MQRLETRNFQLQDKRLGILVPVLALWTTVVICGVVWLLLDEDLSKTFPQYYLFPWVLITAVSIAIPNLYLIKKNQFNFFHPLTFAAWSYFVPGFVVGGLILATGISEPFYMSLISDAQFNLPLTMVYVSLGYLGLSVGFFFPFSNKIGKKLGELLPIWDWQLNQVILPALGLLVIGLANTVLAFAFGILGFQRVEEIGAYDGTLFLLTLLWLEAAFLLCLWLFKSPRLTTNHYFVIALLTLVTFSKAAFQGNRGSLIQIFFMVTMAYVFSGRKITVKHGVYGFILLTLALLIGMIYGTTFRNIKQTEQRISIDQYSEYVFTALGAVFEQNLAANLQQGFSSLADRMESVSSLAVVVSTYEQQQPYEESYGLDNNIIKDSLIFFIPRPLWQDKPVASESHRYADLYFNFSENSFTITPMGDLLRNFGPIGVPLGMILLGFVLRLLYTSLVEVRPNSMWRLMIYYLLLTTISYEAFYSTIIPILFKHGIIAILGVLFIQFFVWQSKRGLRG
jgi:oligosaccharide repeat unit polymerase